jgi:hypothetical protein
VETISREVEVEGVTAVRRFVRWGFNLVGSVQALIQSNYHWVFDLRDITCHVLHRLLDANRLGSDISRISPLVQDDANLWLIDRI